ncbi:MAG TPA: hypothetical protein VH482_14500 [Thermomicrobiales bacterium]
MDIITDLSIRFGSVAWSVQMPTPVAVAIAMTVGLAVVLFALVESA